MFTREGTDLGRYRRCALKHTATRNISVKLYDRARYSNLEGNRWTPAHLDNVAFCRLFKLPGCPHIEGILIDKVNICRSLFGAHLGQAYLPDI